MTTSKSLKIIFTTSLISVGFAIYAATNYLDGSGIMAPGSIYCTVNYDKIKAFYTLLAVSAFFLPTVVILVMYVLIFIVVHKRQKMQRNGELGETGNDRNQRSGFLRDLKVVRMLLVIVGVFILCLCPRFIWILLLCYHPDFNFTDLPIWSFSKQRTGFS
jgi:quinol-cytochrome oxidoreductase complex cytochrome b subunit